ncbi:hypothetical protein F4777DRAFT_516590 [Nemania sp. FL0916]|nr:hypothetical protein F4777DRAFT_516590 [Nemania sp. FL0916]
MSLAVALQSVLFYVVACSPCHRAVHKRQLKREAKKQREAKQLEPAGGYRQPEPFSTNPYWSEEITMGPHVERRKKKSSCPHRSVSAGGASATSSVPITRSNTGATSIANESKELGTSLSRVSDVTISVSAPDAPSAADKDAGYKSTPDMTTALPHDWNHRRYQREDEELWGSELSRTGHKLMDAIKHAGSSAGRFLESSLGKDARLDSDEEDEDTRYFIPVHPPVNDYHPPILRRPPFKGAVRWMVQPPPPARLMEGRIPVSRGSSVSGRSWRTTSIYTESDEVIDGIPISRRTLSRGSAASHIPKSSDIIPKPEAPPSDHTEPLGKDPPDIS